jgi:hypothetical protein
MARRPTRKIKKTGRPNQCQCDKTCSRPALKGKPFCIEHMRGCKRESPLSGCEPHYNPLHWNKRKSIRETHNCFSYAMNVNDPKQIKKCDDSVDDCEAPFHQPGSAAGYSRFDSKRAKTCPNMVARILGDNPNLKMTKFESRCPVNMSKIALVVDPREDYHFLRQDSNHFWSHKAGARPVKNIDAKGHLIWDPSLCDLNYKSDNGVLNYTTFCGYMCVPRKQSLFLTTGGSRPSPNSSFPTNPFRTMKTLKRS